EDLPCHGEAGPTWPRPGAADAPEDVRGAFRRRRGRPRGGARARTSGALRGRLTGAPSPVWITPRTTSWTTDLRRPGARCRKLCQATPGASRCRPGEDRLVHGAQRPAIDRSGGWQWVSDSPSHREERGREEGTPARRVRILISGR